MHLAEAPQADPLSIPYKHSLLNKCAGAPPSHRHDKAQSGANASPQKAPRAVSREGSPVGGELFPDVRGDTTLGT